MKRFSRVLSVVLVLSIIMSMFAALPAMAATAATIKTQTAGSSVTLRATASTSGKSLGSLKDGTAISVESKSGDWYRITANGKTGYVKKEYVNLGSSTSSSSSSSSSTGKLSKAAYLYKSASSSSSKLETLKSGSTVTITGTSGSYYQVKAASGKTGYVLKSSVTVSGTSSTSSAAATGTLSKAAYLYKESNTSSSKLETLKKGSTVSVITKTTSFYKVKSASGKTGYVLKTSVTLSSSGSDSSSLPGDKTGVYTNSSITKPKDVLTTKEEVWNAMSYYLSNFETSFTLKIKNYNGEMMPTKQSQLEYSYLQGSLTADDDFKDLGNNVTAITFRPTYNEAGRVLASMKSGKALASSDTKAVALKKVVDKVLTSIKGKTTYEKIVAIHDYVVLNVAYDEAMSEASYYAYGALVGGKGSCQGYMESVGLLLSAAGIENRCVWANSKMNDSEDVRSHGFIKVKLDGKWYNVDATVDDPKPDVKGRIKRDYLLVTDTVSKQRYDWDTTRYPASTTDNNWHKRNGLVANTQAELEKLVKAGAAKKQAYISVWIPKYSKGKFSVGFASKISGVKSAKATTTPAASSYSTWGTALLFTMQYN